MKRRSSDSHYWKRILATIGQKITPENCKKYDWEINYFRRHEKRYLFTLSLIERYLENYSNPSILDIGSFPLHISVALKLAGYNVVSMDIDPYRSELAKIFDLQVLQIDIEKDAIPKTVGKFDIVLFLEVLEHLRIDLIKVLKELRHRSEKRGLLILSTPNLYSFSNIISYLRGKGLTGPSTYDEWLKIEQIGHVGHVRLYSEYEIRFLLNRIGFRVLKSEKQHFGKPSYSWKKILALLVMTLLPWFRSYTFCISQKK